MKKCNLRHWLPNRSQAKKHANLINKRKWHRKKIERVFEWNRKRNEKRRTAISCHNLFIFFMMTFFTLFLRGLSLCRLSNMTQRIFIGIVQQEMRTLKTSFLNLSWVDIFLPESARGIFIYLCIKMITFCMEWAERQHIKNRKRNTEEIYSFLYAKHIFLDIVSFLFLSFSSFVCTFFCLRFYRIISLKEICLFAK